MSAFVIKLHMFTEPQKRVGVTLVIIRPEVHDLYSCKQSADWLHTQKQLLNILYRKRRSPFNEHTWRRINAITTK